MQTQQEYGIEDVNVYYLNEGEFVMPGFVDTHIHAPQYPNAGLGYDKQLLDWLTTYTFPLEKKYVDVDFAIGVYESVVRKTLASGTTTATYFATIHYESSLFLADIVERLGQRAFIGKVNMNHGTPEGYGEHIYDSFTCTEQYIRNIQCKRNELVQPIITPRFALNCDMQLMMLLGELAAKYNVHIQTVLAHGIHLSDDELKVLAARGTSISHCPNSNTSLKSGLCDVRRLLDTGIKVGLGTDVSGGYSISILNAIRSALQTSTHIFFKKHQGSGYIPLSYHEAFYLATLGGAKALSVDDKTGNFKVGKDFDALIVNMRKPGPIDILDKTDIKDLIQKFLYTGDDRNISKVYVAGRQVK
ncbi:hypothetical protein B7P43_G10556 [Cryptotermes secundus]|uniref:Amidohydrolase-related domain-containing protein n=1 Tax=Cryptotermes secundus TaxID=105785 RepID=A0A2J7PX77_9NEOP|nr:hypothetical protein B7P43_G10556 [Cryptotermes secundus]